MDNDLEKLIKRFSKLPSLGPRSARRIVLHLINNKNKIMLPLIDDINNVKNNIKHCKICRNLDSNDICNICKNDKRKNGTICIIEEIADLWAFEKSGIFNGRYHVLGGVLSAINGVGPEDLNIDSLISRIKGENIEEVIIATNPTIDGTTTSYYLAEILKDFDIKISKLAHGIPIGGELDYLDEGTIGVAFNGRVSF